MSYPGAMCQNCGKEWELTKPPSEYSRGVTCPNCKSTRVELDRSDVDETGGEPSRRTDRAPARDGGPPERQQGQQGMGGAEATIALLDSDVDTQKRAQAAQTAASFGGNLISRAFQYMDQKEKARDQRAQNVDLEPEDKYPDCGECGYQFTGDDISLNDETVQCPDCGSVYRVRDQPADAEVNHDEG